jgi:hypothetical protein
MPRNCCAPFGQNVFDVIEASPSPRRRWSKLRVWLQLATAGKEQSTM